VGLAGGVFGVFFLYGAFGAADVKLACAIGALKGWYFALLAIGASAWWAACWRWRAHLEGQLRRGLRDSFVALVRPGRLASVRAEATAARLTVPYCFAISVGTLWVWLARTGAF